MVDAPADLTCDACVIGGGIIGASVAAHLARAGVSVIILEKGDLASGASGVSGGWAAIHFTSYMASYPPFHMRFMRAGLESFRSAVEPLGNAVEYRPCGGLSLLYSDEEVRRGGALVEELRRADVEVEILSRAEVIDREPLLAGPFMAAVWSSQAAVVNPTLLVRHFASDASRLGAQVRIGVPATALLTSHGRISGVVTPHGRIRCDTVINAAGIHAPEIGQMAGVRIPVRPDRGQQILLESTQPQLGATVHGRISIHQLNSGHFLLGGIREDVGFDNRVTIEGIGRLCREAVEMLPAARFLNIERLFAGLRPVPVDGLPILGSVPGVRGLLVASLHFGITLSVYVGQLITELVVTGKAPGVLAPYSLDRFA